MRSRGLFQLAAGGAPAAVGGVPPDYFSETGQTVGQPAVRLGGARARRISAGGRSASRAQLQRLDLLRLDHFRALAAHWAIPADAPDARAGTWRATPGRGAARGAACGSCRDLPLVAEDLGVITADVIALMQRLRAAGHARAAVRLRRQSRQPASALPAPARQRRLHRHPRQRHRARLVRGTGCRPPVRASTSSCAQPPLRCPRRLLRAVLGSVAQLAVIPVQDLLGLAPTRASTRPGTTGGNWQWRLPPGALNEALAQRCAQLNAAFGRAREARPNAFATMRAMKLVRLPRGPLVLLLGACALAPKLEAPQLSIVDVQRRRRRPVGAAPEGAHARAEPERPRAADQGHRLLRSRSRASSLPAASRRRAFVGAGTGGGGFRHEHDDQPRRHVHQAARPSSQVKSLDYRLVGKVSLSRGVPALDALRPEGHLQAALEPVVELDVPRPRRAARRSRTPCRCAPARPGCGCAYRSSAVFSGPLAAPACRSR